MHAPVVAMACLTALAGCSGGAVDAPSPSPSASAPASASAPSASAGPSLATLPAAECLTGTWELVRFVGASDQTYGTGEGGDVTVRFADGGYTLRGAGQEPITVTLAGRTADLTVDGRAAGTFTVDGSTATFTQESTSGSARIGGDRLTMDQVTSVVGLTGEGRVACTADAMTVTLSGVRLELGRT